MPYPVLCLSLSLSTGGVTDTPLHPATCKSQRVKFWETSGGCSSENSSTVVWNGICQQRLPAAEPPSGSGRFPHWPGFLTGPIFSSPGLSPGPAHSTKKLLRRKKWKKKQREKRRGQEKKTRIRMESTRYHSADCSILWVFLLTFRLKKTNQAKKIHLCSVFSF